MRRKFLVAVTVSTLIVASFWAGLRSRAEQPISSNTASSSPAGVDIAALQQTWTSLAAANYISQVQAALKQQTADSAFKTAVANESVRRLVQTDSAAQSPYRLVRILIDWARPQLTVDQMTALRTVLLSRQDSARDLSGADLRDKVGAMHATGFQRDQTDQNIKDWLDARDIKLIGTSDLEWCCLGLTESDASTNQGLSVKWTGSIRAPQTGQYKFSGSILQIGLRSQSMTIKSVMKVFIDDQLVFDNGSEKPISQMVNLSADKPSQIRIEYKYEHNRVSKRLEFPHPPIAMLYWEGPGVQRQLVPTTRACVRRWKRSRTAWRVCHPRRQLSNRSTCGLASRFFLDDRRCISTEKRSIPGQASAGTGITLSATRLFSVPQHRA